MSDKLINTEVGGEQTQYEGVHTYIEPHSKQAGQLGGTSQGTSIHHHQSTSATDEPNASGVSKSDKIRYGQSIQEGGMGGKTTSSSGEANAGTGFGGTEALSEGVESAAKERREQGYGGNKDMDRNVGA